MYQYKFVRIPLAMTGFFSNTFEPTQDYQELIIQHGKEGWRLVQIFAPPVRGYGRATFYELIFEKPTE